MKIAAVLGVLAIALPVPAHAFNEADFLRQSKFCEAATRQRQGDVDQHAWGDCLMHQGKLRTEEQREADLAEPRTPWMAQLRKSALWATDEGCEALAARARNSRTMSFMVAWNRCMERAGIFTSPR